jgi:integrase
VKNGITHLVPLPPTAARIFCSALGATKGVAVFPAHRGGDIPISRAHVSRTFASVAAKLGILDARLHDLRHCCATGMAALGGSTDVRQRVMNQISGQGIGGRYDQHDDLAEKRRALDLWEERLLQIVEGCPASGTRR